MSSPQQALAAASAGLTSSSPALAPRQRRLQAALGAAAAKAARAGAGAAAARAEAGRCLADYTQQLARAAAAELAAAAAALRGEREGAAAAPPGASASSAHAPASAASAAAQLCHSLATPPASHEAAPPAADDEIDAGTDTCAARSPREAAALAALGAGGGGGGGGSDAGGHVFTALLPHWAAQLAALALPGLCPLGVEASTHALAHPHAPAADLGALEACAAALLPLLARAQAELPARMRGFAAANARAAAARAVGALGVRGGACGLFGGGTEAAPAPAWSPLPLLLPPPPLGGAPPPALALQLQTPALQAVLNSRAALGLLSSDNAVPPPLRPHLQPDWPSDAPEGPGAGSGTDALAGAILAVARGCAAVGAALLAASASGAPTAHPGAGRGAGAGASAGAGEASDSDFAHAAHGKALMQAHAHSQGQAQAQADLLDPWLRLPLFRGDAPPSLHSSVAYGGLVAECGMLAAAVAGAVGAASASPVAGAVASKGIAPPPPGGPLGDGGAEPFIASLLFAAGAGAGAGSSGVAASPRGLLLLAWLQSRNPLSRIEKRRRRFPNAEVALLAALIRHAPLSPAASPQSQPEARAHLPSPSSSTSSGGSLPLWMLVERCLLQLERGEVASAGAAPALGEAAQQAWLQSLAPPPLLALAWARCLDLRRWLQVGWLALRQWGGAERRPCTRACVYRAPCALRPLPSNADRPCPSCSLLCPPFALFAVAFRCMAGGGSGVDRVRAQRGGCGGCCPYHALQRGLGLGISLVAAPRPSARGQQRPLYAHYGTR